MTDSMWTYFTAEGERPRFFKVSGKPVQLTLSNERSGNEYAVAKNSNADRNSAL